MHARAPVRRHLDILYDGVNIGAERFADLYFRCLERTGTAVTPFNIFQRFQTRHDLLRYFEATFSIAGARVECGAYRGATGLLLCHAWRALDATFDGRGLYLVDSFSGTAESGAKDLIPVRGPDGVTRHEPFFPPRKSDVTADMVERFFDEFPAVRICEGWIRRFSVRSPKRATRSSTSISRSTKRRLQRSPTSIRGSPKAARFFATAPYSARVSKSPSKSLRSGRVRLTQHSVIASSCS
ncbi:MAG: hypothetical protein ACXWUK_12075 [Burkholderiales bacterium]